MRQVTQQDAPELARLIHVVWPHHNPDPDWIARVSLESNHVTLVEQTGGRLVGFVDAFSTAAGDGSVRWEVDLLGVHPDYRGRGIAQGLVRAAVDAGRAFGAETTRALVKIDNSVSLNTFRRCGFVADETVCDLWVSGEAVGEYVSAPPTSHLIAVSTLTYSGVWVEGEDSPEALRCAQGVRTRYGWDVAGAVFPSGASQAEQSGYESVGQYRWMLR